MKASVTEDCISCGLCVSLVPEVFQFGDDGLAHAIVDPVPEELEDKAKEAADSCPTSAIIIEE